MLGGAITSTSLNLKIAIRCCRREEQTQGTAAVWSTIALPNASVPCVVRARTRTARASLPSSVAAASASNQENVQNEPARVLPPALPRSVDNRKRDRRVRVSQSMY